MKLKFSCTDFSFPCWSTIERWRVRYVEYVREQMKEANYDAAVAAA